MRAFLAVEFPEDVTRRISELFADVRRARERYRWVLPEHVHWTLRFLGECDPDAVRGSEDAFACALAGRAPFELALGEVGTFGPPAAPRVLWLGPTAGRERLEGLQADVERVCRELGFEAEERPWIPHATLARARRARRGGRRGREPTAERADTFESLAAPIVGELAALRCPVRRITMMSSQLTPRGPIHDPVWRVPLGAESHELS